MNPKIITYILSGGQVIATLVPLTLDILNRLHSIFSASGIDFVTEVTQIREGAVADAQDTLAAVAAWKASKGKTD